MYRADSRSPSHLGRGPGSCRFALDRAPAALRRRRTAQVQPRRRGQMPAALLAGVSVITQDIPERSASPLLAVPTEAQQRLLEIVYRAYCHFGSWPIYQYVEALFYDDLALDARLVILQCPTVAFLRTSARYGWFWPSEGRFEAVPPQAKVGLTVSRMTLLTCARTEVQLFLDVLGYLVRRERDFSRASLASKICCPSGHSPGRSGNRASLHGYARRSSGSTA
jgi:hypothetical protein